MKQMQCAPATATFWRIATGIRHISYVGKNPGGGSMARREERNLRFVVVVIRMKARVDKDGEKWVTNKRQLSSYIFAQ